MAKPQYIEQLEKRIEVIDNRTESIHIALMGTEYDKVNVNGKGGGFVKRLGNVENDVEEIKTWKTKSKARNAVIWIVVGGALTALWTLIVSKWNNIIN